MMFGFADGSPAHSRQAAVPIKKGSSFLYVFVVLNLSHVYTILNV